jgi:hypothetical protein
MYQRARQDIMMFSGQELVAQVAGTLLTEKVAYGSYVSTALLLSRSRLRGYSKLG